MKHRHVSWPFVLPVAGFAVTILVGTLLLWWSPSHAGAPVALVDALFIATSCVCVTGLATIDIATVFSPFGQSVMMALMQLGGLGITTYTSLFFYLLTKRVSLTDRLAVGGALLHDQSFHLGRFLIRIALMIFGIEAAGFLAFYLMEPSRIGLFNAAFLAVSSFCNAGFAPWTDNLIGFQQHAGVNITVMLLIIFGGLGFAVIDEVRFRLGERARYALARLRSRQTPAARPGPLSFQAQLVLKTTAFLVFGGALCFFLSEYFLNKEDFFEPSKVILPSFFQSVTCRTAGFATVNIGRLTDLALLVMIGLMFIGGSSGSCAGGIKTGSFRVLVSFCRSAVRGREQVLIGRRAVSREDLSKVFMLLTFSLITIIAGVVILAISEGGANIHGRTPFQILDLTFEVVSAFATVGLSTGVTPELSAFGKVVISAQMFIGRLGPIWLITMMQKFQDDVRYQVPEAVIPIG